VRFGAHILIFDQSRYQELPARM